MNELINLINLNVMNEVCAQEQADELLVLQAVFGSDIRVGEPLPRDGGPPLSVLGIDIGVDIGPVHVRACPRVIPTATPSALPSFASASSVEVPLARDPRRMVDLGGSSEADQTPLPPLTDVGELAATVIHLPPLHLALVLPYDYPLSAPPHFTLHASWLTAAQLSACADELERMWEQSAGSAVLFCWVDWLRHGALELLGLPEQPTITLYPNGLVDAQGANGDAAGDARIVCECADPTSTLEALLRHSWEAEQRVFAHTVHTCPICLDEKPGDACVSGVGGACSHASCRECLVAMVDAAVGSGACDAIRCPVAGCRVPLSARLISQVRVDWGLAGG